MFLFSAIKLESSPPSPSIKEGERKRKEDRDRVGEEQFYNYCKW